jgi:hypothetical protein
MILDQVVQPSFCDVAEWRMPQVVCESAGLHSIRVQFDDALYMGERRFRLGALEAFCQAARYVGNLQRMHDAVVNPESGFGRGDLGYAAKSPKRRGVKNAVTIALKL